MASSVYVLVGRRQGPALAGDNATSTLHARRIVRSEPKPVTRVTPRHKEAPAGRQATIPAEDHLALRGSIGREDRQQSGIEVAVVMPVETHTARRAEMFGRENFHGFLSLRGTSHRRGTPRRVYFICRAPKMALPDAAERCRKRAMTRAREANSSRSFVVRPLLHMIVTSTRSV